MYCNDGFPWSKFYVNCICPVYWTSYSHCPKVLYIWTYMYNTSSVVLNIFKKYFTLYKFETFLQIRQIKALIWVMCTLHLVHGFRVEFTKRSWCIKKLMYGINWKFKFSLQCPRHGNCRTALWQSLCANEYRNILKEWNNIWNNIYKFVTTRRYVMIIWLYQILIFFFYISVNKIII